MSSELVQRIANSSSGVYHVNSIFYHKGDKIAELELPYHQLGKLETFNLPRNHPAYRHGVASKGVRAKEEIATDSIIGFYAGIYRPGIFGPENPYVFGVHPQDSDMVIDALKVGNITRYINDPRGTQLMSNLEAEDVIIRHGAHTIRCVQFKITRNILAGEELLLEYEASTKGYWNAYQPRVEIIDLTFDAVKSEKDSDSDDNRESSDFKWAGSRMGNEIVELAEKQFTFLLEKFRTYAMGHGMPNKMLEEWLQECQTRMKPNSSNQLEYSLSDTSLSDKEVDEPATGVKKRVRETTTPPLQQIMSRPTVAKPIRKKVKKLNPELQTELQDLETRKHDLQSLIAVNSCVKENFIKTREAFRRIGEQLGVEKLEEIFASWKKDEIEENDSLTKFLDAILHGGPHLLHIARYSRLRPMFLKNRNLTVKEFLSQAPFQVKEYEFTHFKALSGFAGGGFILRKEYRSTGEVWNSEDIKSYFNEFDARIREHMDGNLLAEFDVIGNELRERLRFEV